MLDDRPTRPADHVVGLREIDRTQVALVGGKAANLGELTRIPGVHVPDGYCVTTRAFREVVAEAPSVRERLGALASLDPDDREGIRVRSAEIRGVVEALPIPDEVAAAITGALARLGPDTAVAVRSSATAEDTATASSAGQQDTYLDVVGPAAVLEHVRRCWASLFTERAVSYRLRHGVDHRRVEMAVVVQRMVVPDAAGVLFTADPTTSNREVAAVEAVPGLGEALVSGRVDPDVYRVRDGDVVERRAGPRPVLTDEQVVRLAALGRRIEAHFGRPQDVEWCLAGGDVAVVQSRLITTLFPVPETEDGQHHVYVSVGHQQMMTDPMTPLGLSVWQLTTPRPMAEAGCRLFVDVTAPLASPGRDAFLEMMGRGDPLIRDALQTVLDRGFVGALPDGEPVPPPAGGAPAGIDTDVDPAVVAELIEEHRASLAALERDIRGKSGAELVEFVLADFGELRRLMFDRRGHQVIMAAIDTTWWLNEQLGAWLGERNAADVLTRSAPDNVTSAMGLALLDVVDVIRPHPEVVAFLRDVEGEDFLDRLPALEGGREAQAAIRAYLDEYGMRCVGEIDIGRPRWSERPSTLVPVILGHVENAEPGAGARRFAQGQQEARAYGQAVLARLRALPDGERKADETARMIDRLRASVGYREYPKYGMICRYAVYRRALLDEADRLVRAGVLARREDVVLLRLQELRDVVRTGRVDAGLLRRREEEFRAAGTLTPPRVLTSEGEAVQGSYRRTDVPAGALVGLPVSVGVVEGRARVVLDVAAADLGAEDILVTTSTDPSWSPLFVAIRGLVTEVGGLMTHGAVVAREYGLPAVVGVADATRRIPDGRWIRLDATHGLVELLPER